VLDLHLGRGEGRILAADLSLAYVRFNAEYTTYRVGTLRLFGLLVSILALTALASPWVAWGAARLAGGEFTFARVYDRVFEVLLVVGVAVAWRRLDLGTASELGFRRRAWGHELGRGLGAALLGLAVGFGACALAGALVPALRFPLAKTVWKGLLGCGA